MHNPAASMGLSSKLGIVAAVVALLAACGGGSDASPLDDESLAAGEAVALDEAAAEDADADDASRAAADAHLLKRPGVYRLTDLGVILPNPLVTSFQIYGCLGLNEKGQVTGAGPFPGVFEHAFVFSKGARQDLGILPDGGFSGGCGINDRGQVAGYARYVNPEVQRSMWHAFLYSGTAATQDLGLLAGAPFFAFSLGYAINNRGQVTGYAPLLGGSSHHAFVYSNGVMRDVGTLGAASSDGHAINDRGQVTGAADGQAFLYTSGKLKFLGTLGGSGSVGYGINNWGQVTGTAAVAGDAAHHTFVYSRGVMRDLGCLDGDTVCQGFDINEWGDVVGASGGFDFQDFTSRRAVVYIRGSVRDLNSMVDSSGAGWHLHMANGINRSRQIVGKGRLNGEWHAFLLTPVRPGLPWSR